MLGDFDFPYTGLAKFPELTSRRVNESLTIFPPRQISSDEETQCEDETQSPGATIPVSDRGAEGVNPSEGDFPERKHPGSGLVQDFQGSLDAELSDTQPPLQIDTEDTECTGKALIVRLSAIDV